MRGPLPNSVGTRPASQPQKPRPKWPESKIVDGKQEDGHVLLAQDATRCSVSAKRFARVKVGDAVVCAWHS
jgi:hypothetical protein